MAAGEIPEGIGPAQWTLRRRFGDDDLLVRPLEPTDQARLLDFFASHTPETRYQRYFAVKKELTPREAAHLCTLDYRDRMAFAVLTAGPVERIVGIGRYDRAPGSDLAELALVVGEDWRHRGLGGLLIDLLVRYARAQGLAGVVGYLLPASRDAIELHRARGHRVSWDPAMRTFRVEHRFGEESPPAPAADATAAA